MRDPWDVEDIVQITALTVAWGLFGWAIYLAVVVVVVYS